MTLYPAGGTVRVPQTEPSAGMFGSGNRMGWGMCVSTLPGEENKVEKKTGTQSKESIKFSNEQTRKLCNFCTEEPGLASSVHLTGETAGLLAT